MPIEVRGAEVAHKVNHFADVTTPQSIQKYLIVKEKAPLLVPKIQYKTKDYDITISTECNWMTYENYRKPFGISVKIDF